MEILITILIFSLGLYILFKNIKASAKGKCNCSNCSCKCPKYKEEN
ncbi:MAG: FeoB-associated Cys-rich membrane protein [Clostridium perfringens]|nr:FeoB-associated Cys-rich membrane protein [Clostridium perfringens]